MLASEVSYVMSEMTANRGKAAYWGQFLKVCLLEVAKGICPEKKVTLSNHAAKTKAEGSQTWW